MAVGFEVDLAAGGVLGEGETEYEDLPTLDAVGAHAPVPEAEVELAVHGLGVGAVGVEELVGRAGLGDLLEVFGAVEAALAVALEALAGVGRAQCRVDGVVVMPTGRGSRGRRVGAGS
ncbi:hypothetical protein [Streptomyces sp. TLI_185]|uniref:hypothetical protein n=1 Tax=Streptomyces sp. TLI_185 TaxID=2485151 RepID=UPI0016202D6F|nr:hypothetical protein [Streptomyces sp. TLI_185]